MSQIESNSAAILSLEDSEVQDRNINLISNDGKVFQISLKYASISPVITEAFSCDQDTEDLPTSFSSVILGAIIDYFNMCKGQQMALVEKPLRSKIMSEVTDAESAAYMDTFVTNNSKQELYNLISAANYFQIIPLLHLGCAKVAALIKGKPIDEIKSILLDQK